tara:strand:- start:1762 stop:1974 length:213 start_codon:yes stop_codon:yes gene_type:complete
MQKWFNNLRTGTSLAISFLLIIVGLYFFYIRYTNQIGFGYFIGVGILIETMILNYKKYFNPHKLTNEEEE